MLISPERIRVFRRSLVRWYAKHGRDLPWRQTADPYAILVSDIMLQQTQVAAVVPFYERWLKRFPDFGALATARQSDVLHAWQGLGYYNRARNLQAAAKTVVRQHNGALPRDPAEIRLLPGLGRYTSNAVATFAFNQSVPIVEANITRVIARLFNIRLAVDSTAGRERLWQATQSLVPKQNAGRFNSALMDLGALICVKTPRCHACPVRNLCRARRPRQLPIKKARRQTIHLAESHGFVRRHDQILLEKSTGRWRGMWILPRVSNVPTGKQPIHSSIFPFTHHRINLQVFRNNLLPSGSDRRWIPLDSLERIPIPSPHRRALTSLLTEEDGA